MKKILEISNELGWNESDLISYGHYKAKLDIQAANRARSHMRGQLILVTAMSPTPFGEGKTTTSIGLSDALRKRKKKVTLCLREPSLGPVFGMKGGATGSGMAQVVPATDINLHFNGDFSAIALAHNLLSSMIDNHIFHGNELRLDLNRIFFRRVMDLNDRSLRQIRVGLESEHSQRRDSFDIVAASEVMAIFCLSTDRTDLRKRLGQILVGLTIDGEPIYAKDLGVVGSMMALLHQAFDPNLVQTLEGTPVMIHGGPFANIAHGCNSVVATETALNLSDYVVTEAGFGSDLGAEKFINIKCRVTGVYPKVSVIVVTLRALKYHGGLPKACIYEADSFAIEKGFQNLLRHYNIMTQQFGIPSIIAINRFTQDTDAELQVLMDLLIRHNIPHSLCRHWELGSEGALDLADRVITLLQRSDVSQKAFDLYKPENSLEEKVLKVAQKIYHAKSIEWSPEAIDQRQLFERLGYGKLPICIAKTPYSFSEDPLQIGNCENHVLHINEVRLSAGAGFLVLRCGSIITMPGLPKKPAAFDIDVDSDGHIHGI